MEARIMPAGFFAGSTVAQSVAPPPTVAQCGACGLFRGCRSPKMPPTGQGQRKILVVGEAPGEQEDAENEQLIGPAGQQLREILRRHGIDLDRDCWKTNALICRPPENRGPTGAEIAHCRPNVLTTIKTLAPEVIITLGGAAIEAVVGPIWREDVGSEERWVGWQIPAVRYNAWVCPTWHPTDLLRARDPVLGLWCERHLAAAVGRTGRPWPTPPPDYKKLIEVILDTARAAAIIDGMCERGGTFAFDYETNMLKPDGADARIVTCSICWEGRRTIAYPWHGPAIAATQRFLQTPHRKIASNLDFEERWTLKEFGHGVAGWWADTMVGAHCLDPRRGITSIKFQSFIYFGVPIWNAHIEPFLRAKGTREVNQILREVAINDLLLYNGLDSLFEYMVAEAQQEATGIYG